MSVLANAAATRILSAVRDLAPRITERAGEMERARRMPPNLVEDLRSAGVFRMLVPERFGGAGVDVPSSVEILTELSAADGATGWTVMIGCHAPLMFSLFPQSTFDTIYANGPDVIGGGCSAPKGFAERIDAGYKVTGRWPYASGCEHADWMFGVCTETQNGVSIPAPTPGAPPPLRFIVLPAKQWQILDTWHSAGLRGTGSHDISLSETVVPAERTTGFGAAPAPREPRDVNLYMSHHQMYLQLSAVAVGIAEGALCDLTAMGQTGKRRLYSRQELADTPLFQHRLGHAEADVHAAGAFLREVSQQLWDQTLRFNIEASLAARIPQASAWIAETCARAVDSCFRAAGASAIYESSPLQRRLRDIHTLTQHLLVQENAFATAGAKRVGRAPLA